MAKLSHNKRLSGTFLLKKTEISQKNKFMLYTAALLTVVYNNGIIPHANCV